MTPALTIRQETPADIAAIDEVTRQAFLHAEHTEHTEQFIVRALRNANALSVSLVAERDGAIIGHAAASPVRISDGTPRWYGLGPLSVAPAHQSQGVGSELVRRLLDNLRQLGAAGCVVLGDPGYYSRLGFKAGQGPLLAGVPPEYFQAQAFHGSYPSGEVSFHPGFDAQS